MDGENEYNFIKKILDGEVDSLIAKQGLENLRNFRNFNVPENIVIIERVRSSLIALLCIKSGFFPNDEATIEKWKKQLFKDLASADLDEKDKADIANYANTILGMANEEARDNLHLLLRKNGYDKNDEFANSHIPIK